MTLDQINTLVFHAILIMGGIISVLIIFGLPIAYILAVYSRIHHPEEYNEWLAEQVLKEAEDERKRADRK